MNEEIKMLRRALEACQNEMCNLWDYARETPIALNTRAADANAQASFALRVTSGALPPNYSIDGVDRQGRYFPMYRPNPEEAWNWQHILNEKGHAKFFYDEFKARLFCWQDAKEKAEAEA